MPARRFTEEEFMEIYNSGLTIFEIQEKYKVSKNTLKGYCKRYNLKAPKGWYRKPKHLHKPRDRSGKNNNFYGKKHTEETRAKMRANHADFSGDNNPFKKACLRDPNVAKALSDRTVERWASYSKEQKYQMYKKTVIGDLSQHHWSRIKGNAKTRGLELAVTAEYVWNLFNKQGGKCALSGVELNLRTCDDITASLDRIDSKKGYIEGNVQWVHKDVNLAKMNMPNDSFITMCALVVQHQSSLGNF